MRFFSGLGECGEAGERADERSYAIPSVVLTDNKYLFLPPSRQVAKIRKIILDRINRKYRIIIIH